MDNATEAYARDSLAVDNSANYVPKDIEPAPFKSQDDVDSSVGTASNDDSATAILTDTAQNDRGISVKLDRTRDDNLTSFGKATLLDRYLLPDESFQDIFARVAIHYADDSDHAQRLYDYISNLWFMPSTPVLSNGGTERGLPISCFLNEATDSLGGILAIYVLSANRSASTARHPASSRSFASWIR
jgi:ribonucleoside-diphosphate reductase alpha chain